MEAAQIGYYLGGFITAVVIGFAWLALTWLIPYFRRNKRPWFLFAAVVVWLVGFISIQGYTAGHALGAVFFTAYGLWRTRAKPAPTVTPSPAP